MVVGVVIVGALVAVASTIVLIIAIMGIKVLSVYWCSAWCRWAWVVWGCPHVRGWNPLDKWAWLNLLTPLDNNNTHVRRYNVTVRERTMPKLMKKEKETVTAMASCDWCSWQRKWKSRACAHHAFPSHGNLWSIGVSKFLTILMNVQDNMTQVQFKGATKYSEVFDTGTNGRTVILVFFFLFLFSFFFVGYLLYGVWFRGYSRSRLRRKLLVAEIWDVQL